MILQLNHIFYYAKSRSERIPWLVREPWTRQIAHAVENVHSKGHILGKLDYGNVGLRVDGSAIPVRLETSRRYPAHGHAGNVPLELRGPDVGRGQSLNDRTDIFRLGMMLWLLADHHGNNTASGCSRNACTSILRYKCTADHSNPITLPPSIGHGVPAYFSSIIVRCCSPNPTARPTAGDIVAEISSSQSRHIQECPEYTLKVLKSFYKAREIGATTAHEWSPDNHYHCYACDGGNFDLCEHCVVAQGLHCYVPEHKLVKMVFSELGGYVQVYS